MQREWQLLERSSRAVVVDVGFGEHAHTTAEMARRFRDLNPSLEIVGVEADSERVERAKSAYENIDARTGGFPLSESVERPARLVRAMNVLREYKPSVALAAYQDWAEPLVDGGLLAAGSSDKFGDVMGVLLARKVDGVLRRESLLFATTFENGFGPWMFRDWLPRDLRRSVGEGDAVYELLEQWNVCFEVAREEGDRAPKVLFCRSAERLVRSRSDITWDWLCGGAFLLWTPGEGIPVLI